MEDKCDCEDGFISSFRSSDYPDWLGICLGPVYEAFLSDFDLPSMWTLSPIYRLLAFCYFHFGYIAWPALFSDWELRIKIIARTLLQRMQPFRFR